MKAVYEKIKKKSLIEKNHAYEKKNLKIIKINVNTSI